MSTSSAIAARLRVLLVIVLLLAQVVLPVLAAQCATADVAIDTASAAAIVAVDAVDGDRDCCDNPACSDCCLHASAAPPAPSRAAAVSFIAIVPSAVAIVAVRGSYPVDFRPPITV